MNKISNILVYLKNYKVYVFLNVFFNLLYAAFNLFSMAAVIPFLNIIFKQSEPIYTRPEFKINLQVLLDFLSYYITLSIEKFDSQEAGLVLVAILVAITFFFKNLFRYLAKYFIIPIRNGVVKDLRVQLHNKLLSLPLSYFNRKRKGDLISNLTADVVEVEHSVMSVLETFIKEPLVIISSLFVLFIVDISLTLFVLLLVILIALFIGQIGRTLKKKSFQGQSKLGLIASMYDETISGMRIIKAFTAEKFKQKQFSTETIFFEKLMNNVLRKRDLASPLTEFLIVLVFSSVIWFGGKEVLSGDVTAAVLIFYLMAFASITAPAKSFSSGYYNLQKGLGAVQRLKEILQEKEDIEEHKNPIAISKFEHNLKFENVTFSYHNYDDRAVLKNINLDIKKGSLIALVGSSGAGKTTLADLVPRFYDVVNGKITLDGKNIKEYAKQDLRSLMGVVTQESILFNDTVFNNISFGINATQEQVEEAAKVANAHDFIHQMPDGYQTVIGDRGQNLSGGQRQRLTIARAVLKNPPILILDEATSALDSESEKLVQDALIKLMRNRTSIVIAHRLSTIQYADEIIVMEDGKIMEKGNHIGLIAKNGMYKKLVELQAF